MADIELVIKISEEEYVRIQSMDWKNGDRIYDEAERAIHYGTPLPKGHGRLIDADALWKKWVFDAIGKQEIDEALTIIEADKAESEG